MRAIPDSLAAVPGFLANLKERRVSMADASMDSLFIVAQKAGVDHSYLPVFAFARGDERLQSVYARSRPNASG
jgi:hypothetical protein